MDSLIKEYTNGYMAHWIDRHPNRNVFRNQDFEPAAYPEEKIVVLKDGAVCIYLEGLKDLKLYETQLRLEEKKERA